MTIDLSLKQRAIVFLCFCQHQYMRSYRTRDAWTVLTTESYVTVTSHYINYWKIQSAVLQTKVMLEQHTAKYLVNAFSTFCQHVILTSKVRACSHDNISNKQQDWNGHQCFALTTTCLQLNSFKLSPCGTRGVRLWAASSGGGISLLIAL